MKLRLSDAIRISWSNVGGHKVRSLLTIATIAILFGVMLGVNFVLQGLEDTVVAASVVPTAGKAYVESQFYVASGVPSTMTEEEILNPDFVKRRAELEADADEYSGKLVGVRTSFNDRPPVEIISVEAVEEYIELDLASVPEEKIPVLVPWKGFSFDEAMYGMQAEELQQDFENNFYIVGVMPMTEKGRLGLGAGNPLNFLLLSVPSRYARYPILVDDGLGAVQKYLEERIDTHQQQREEDFAEMVAADPEMDEEDYRDAYDYIMSQAIQVDRAAIFQFDDPRKAIAYALQPYDYANYLMQQDLFSNTISVARSFAGLKNMLVVIEVILLIVAVVIATLTFGHMIDQDAATIALYRAMGATKLQIMLIYFCYLVELCVLALVACVIIALGIAGVTTLMNAGELSRKLQEFYRLAEAPQVWFVALNWVTWTVVGAILVIAPVTLLLSDRHFSARNIARKLKED